MEQANDSQNTQRCAVHEGEFPAIGTLNYNYLPNSSLISSTFDGWQQTAKEDRAGSNKGATYSRPTLTRSAKVTWDILSSKVLGEERPVHTISGKLGTNVYRDRFPIPTPCMGWVCVLFTLLRKAFSTPGYFSFPVLFKTKFRWLNPPWF